MTVDEKLNTFIAETLRLMALTMADVQALKTLHIVHQPNGRQSFSDALSVAMKGYQPILDSLAQANDQKLLELLKGLRGPVH